MVEHNYYQLMQLEPFADVSLVKKKYRELALLYHPDKNPKNKHAEEYFKVITQGYTILNEPARKQEYDMLLRNYLQNRNSVNPAIAQKRDLRERIRRNREMKRMRIIDDYVAAENEFPHRYRMWLGILTLVSGILMAYNNWFVNYLRYDIMFVILGFMLFGLGCYLIANNVYRREAFRKALRAKYEAVSGKAVGVFMSSLFGIPFLFLFFTAFISKFQLERYPDYTPVRNITVVQDEVLYSYVVDDVEISRKTGMQKGVDYKHYNLIRVRFSRINPNISELVFIDQPIQP